MFRIFQIIAIKKRLFLLEFFEYFTLSRNENQVTLSVETELDLEAFEQNEIYLIVKADRNYTSGATATIILQLPEGKYVTGSKLI